MDELASFCKRRGLVYPNSEIYGGVAGFYDYGPIGVEIANNIKKEWWKAMVHDNRDIVGINGAIISHPKVWEASGHVGEFTDFLVSCEKKHQFRADNLLEDVKKIKTEGMGEKELNENLKDVKCPTCKAKLGKVSRYHLMFETYVGPGSKEPSYLRPETAQLIYLNFKNVLDTTRQKLPFGIAQIGKAFRNEISPRNFLFRMREFEQMEMQFFLKEKDAAKSFERWQKSRMDWYVSLGINKEKLRFREHAKTELAHYAKKAIDIEYNFDFGWKEIEGIHNRGDWDLSQHEKFSKQDLKYFEEETKERILPWIIETSAGLDRNFLVFISDAYHEEEVKGEKRIVLKLHPKIAAYKAAVFPLVNKDKLPEKAIEIYENIRRCFPTIYDDKGSIGRRYRRMDEIGTPFCITIDHQTLEDDTVTLRDRDSMEQKRVKISELSTLIFERLV